MDKNILVEEGRIVVEDDECGPQIIPSWKLVVVASIAAGVQFGWALQLSLLTPYVQLLGVPHTWASLVWLCGPISGMIVQPIVGDTSDRCFNSKFGRRKPFILTDTALICMAVLLIGFAADIGVKLGDSLSNPTKPRVVAFFVIGFWMLHIASNMVQDPARAFLADLAKDNHRKMRIAKCILLILHGGWQCSRLCGWQLYKFLPFTLSHGCDTYCANLKTCWLPSFSIPFALASMFSSDSGAGHGRSLGVLNLAIVIPQMFVSLLSGLCDKLFGGGNLAAFMVGVVAALIDAFLAFFVLPPPSSNA